MMMKGAVVAGLLLFVCPHLAALEKDPDEITLKQLTTVSDKAAALGPKIQAAVPGSQEQQDLQAQQTQLQQQGDQIVANCHGCVLVETKGSQIAMDRGDMGAAQAYADQAVSAADAASTPDPTKLTAALDQRGMVEFKTGNYSQAMADAQRVLAMSPTDAPAQAVYYNSKAQLTALSVDAKTGKAAKNLADGMAEPNLGPGGLRATKNGDARAAAGNDPRFAATAQDLAATKRLDEAESQLNVDDAKKALSTAQAIQSSNPLIVARGDVIQAQAWAALKDLSKAVALISQTINIFARQGSKGDLAQAYGQRAQYQNDLDRPGDAVADANSALENDPKLASAFYERSRGNELLGKVDAATEDVDRAAALDPGFMTRRDEFHKRHLSDAHATQAANAASARTWLTDVSAKGGIKLLVAAGIVLILAGLSGKFFVKKGSPKLEEFPLPGATPEPTPAAPLAKAERVASAPSSFELAEGMLVDGGKYRIGPVIGRGGMGTVYKARDLGLDRDVAIKRLNEALLINPSELDRFVKEGRVVARLRHPGIVTVYSHVREGDLSLIVFEFIEGGTLYDALRENGRTMAPGRALKILSQVAAAVDYANEAGIIHRDLKPSNIMLEKGDKALVTDFGIARVTDHMATSTLIIVGTPQYMAPEQVDGKVSRQLDVFAVGVIAYELLTGYRPFDGETAQWEKRHGRFKSASQLMPDLSAAVDPIFKKVLDPEHTRRHACCSDFCRELEAALRQPTPPIG
jgi:tetratricopeptide (TPR) repeat protein